MYTLLGKILYIACLIKYLKNDIKAFKVEYDDFIDNYFNYVHIRVLKIKKE